MMTALLIVIYISFISLGIPDSMLGVAWPAIYQEFDLPIGLAGYISFTIAGCTTVSSLMSTRLIRRFGTGLVTAVSIALTVAGLFGFSCSRNVIFFFLMAIPLGLGAGAIDSGLNSFVALHYSAAQINYLQCFYGIGVALSPYLMSLALGENGDWRGGYRMVGCIQIAICVMGFLALPLWKKTQKQIQVQEDTQTRVLSLGQMLRMPAARYTSLVFLTCCAVELTFGGWSSTYFVNSKGLAADKAAQITMLFYIGMAFSRFLSGALSGKLSCWQMIWISSGILLVAIPMLMLPLSINFAAVALFFCGCGVGPLFGCLTHLTPGNFGRDIASSVIGLQLAASYVGIMVMPYLFGQLAQLFSTAIFPYFQMLFHILFLISLFALIKTLKKAPLV